MNNELNLLAEALSTQGEAEQGGVKYIYMDDSTIYRFENNRMKKVSAAMIKKANKLLDTQGSLPNDTPEKLKPKGKKVPAPKGKKTKVREPEPEEADDEEESTDEEPEPEPVPKKVKKVKETPAPKKARVPKVDSSANIDLNEYYNNKNRMEFMSIEIDRLTNKVNKLKQYKSIVNKITGGEYEAPEPISEPQSQYTQRPSNPGPQGRRVNDSLFDFN